MYVCVFAVMLEASAEIMPMDTFYSAIAAGAKASTKIAEEIHQMCTDCGKVKREASEMPTCKEEIIASMKR